MESLVGTKSKHCELAVSNASGTLRWR